MSADAIDLPARFGQLSLADAVAAMAAQRLPPVDRWNPPDRGDSHIEICADGSWWHQGRQIKRPQLVRLFASILRREPDGRYALVTPHEKLAISVADLPFRAVELRSEGAGADRRLLFRLDSGDLVLAGPDHPLRFGSGDGEPRPALHVRGPIGMGLEARLTRSLYYELAEMALAEGGDAPAIWSNGARFELAA
jgi:hypothetical protein